MSSTQPPQRDSRRKGSAATENEARQPPNEELQSTQGRSTSTPRRSQSTTKRSGNASTNATTGTDTSTSNRSGSQPKQRASGRATSVGKNATPSDKTPTQTPFEAAMARMKKAAVGKTEDQLELLLQQLLQQRLFEDAAYLIASAPALEVKYKTSDVIRLLLDIKQFEKAAQLIRDMKLHQNNQLLVTLFIKELVREGLFQSAVRYSQEMVQNFGKNDFGPRDQARPSWTPQALIQAMIRAQQYRSALKYAKQFDLLELFPPAQLIANMFEVRSWDEGVSSVLEFRLFKEFPLELLAQKLLQHRQWSNAIKCINKLSSKELVDQCNVALVREAARVGDFVSSLRYLREFKFDTMETHASLLKYFVDCMIAHGELYKAIKYSIEFGLNAPPPDAEETGETSVYDTELLIRKAIDVGQYHVAVTYIKKLKLKDQFAKELELIKQYQQQMLAEFHQYVAAREMQFQHPQVQSEIASILGANVYEEKVGQVVETEVVLSVEEEIVPRKPRKPVDEVPAFEEVAPLAEVSTIGEGRNGRSVSIDETSGLPRRSSRFSFARATDVESPSPVISQLAPPQPTPAAQPTAPTRSLPPGFAPPPPNASMPPPGLAPARNASPPGLAPLQNAGAPPSAPSPSSSFNFAQFAANLQPAPGRTATPPPPPPAPPSQPPLPMPPQQGMTPQQGLGHLFPHQSPQQPPGGPRPMGGFYPPPPPPPQFNGMPGQHGYAGPPPPQQRQVPQAPPMYFQHGNQQGFPNGSMPPPPPMPQHHLMGSNSSGMNPAFDVSSLAMQFHARPQAPGFGAYGPPGGQGPYGQGGPPPPPMPPGMPGGLFPTMQPPMQPYPPQPQSSFKPSMSYTSVTMTRQKKG